MSQTNWATAAARRVPSDKRSAPNKEDFSKSYFEARLPAFPHMASMSEASVRRTQTFVRLFPTYHDPDLVRRSSQRCLFLTTQAFACQLREIPHSKCGAERGVGDQIMRSASAVAVHVDAVINHDLDVVGVFHCPVSLPLAHSPTPVLAE